MGTTLTKPLNNKFTAWLNQEVEAPRRFPLSDFDRIQYELRPGDVLLIEGRTRVSQIIKMITHSNWSHAALYIGRLYDIEDPVLREKVKHFYQGEPESQLILESLLGQGAILAPVTKYSQEHIRLCRPMGISRHDAQSVISYAVDRLGREYDFRQILDLARFLLPWPIMPRRWHSTLFKYKPGQSTKESCSSLIAEAFQSVDFPILPVLKHDRHGIELVQRNPRLFTPSDFDYSPFFEIIKYPIIELIESGLYRKLPWSKELHEDEETRPTKKSSADSSEFFD